jgi:uncharacterized protein (DUF488 family)
VRLWSIGHSTHPPERLVELLRAHAIELVADVRTVPRSRRHPQFESSALASWLPEDGIAYEHLPRLGGWRSPRPDSPNGGWRNRSFRGYADHAMGEEFAAGLEELTAEADRVRTAMMCSEALWWRCHRRLIADRLVGAGREVLHIGADGRAEPHRLTSFAVPGPGGVLLYPPGADPPA